MPQADHTAFPKNSEKLSGAIERVTFHSPETGFCVLQVKARGKADLFPVVGTLPNVSAGEWVEAEGRWTIDSEHGRQFRAETLRTAPPDTPQGMERYLGSGLIKGIGPQFAHRLVDAFGREVFEVIEHSAERLLEVEGIGAVRKERIVRAWREQKVVREIMVFLHSHGVGTSRAFRIYKTYGETAIEQVMENPYRLAQDIRGIGFKTADRIAASLGVERASDLRARAGVEYVLHELTEEGHCAYPREGLVERAVKMLELTPEIIERAVAHRLDEGRLVERPMDGSPLIYLSPMEAQERLLARNLLQLSRGRHPCPSIDLLKAVEWLEGALNVWLAQGQREALEEATHSKVMVLTGGPGVGKTTLIQAMVRIFQAKRLSVVLCAPTGRAAKRMSEASGIEAKTIHRLLEFDPATGGFKRDGTHPLEGDVFVADESSMIDLTLAHQLVRAIPRGAALIPVGDIDQLPSVGPGNVLRDIIDSGAVPVCRLTEVFRQAAQSAIITNAHRINRGETPQWPKGKVESPTETDFYFVKAEEPTQGVDLILKLVRERIPQRFGFDPVSEIQALTPMQRGELGARNLEGRSARCSVMAPMYH